MLTTDTYELQASIDELDDHIGRLEDSLEGLEAGTEEYNHVQNRIDRLSYFRDGLVWQRDEEGWDEDVEIELGALTAAEEAKMHREMTTDAERKERRLWYVAACTVDAPYASADLSETFTALGQCHPAFADWAEAKANALGVPGVKGNSSEGEPNSTS